MRDFYSRARCVVSTNTGYYEGEVMHTDINGNYYVRLNGAADLDRYNRADVWLLDDLEMEQN